MTKYNWIFIFGMIVTLIPFTTVAEDITTPLEVEILETIDLKTVTCRKFLKFDGEEKDNVMAFLHGYISGTQNNTVIDIDAFGEASDKIMDMCIDTPTKILLDVFKANR